MSLSKEEKDYILSQIEQLAERRPLFYLKFCSEQAHVDDILGGKLYANTVQFFREKELKSGIRGQGDKNELTLCLKTDSIQAYDSETRELAFTISNATMRIHYNDDSDIPLVCFVGIPFRDMTIINVDEKEVEFALPFSEQEYADMEKEFGKYCVIIAARELETRIRQRCQQSDIDFIFDQVRYVVPNSLEKIKAFQEGVQERFLFKDKDLSYQREYRWALAAEMPEDHYFCIGKLTSAKQTSASELKNLHFFISYTTKDGE